jgi:hypothetical protein
VHGIARQAGGCVALESTPGQGATFRVFLPRLEQPRAAGSETETPEPPIAGRPVGTL